MQSELILKLASSTLKTNNYLLRFLDMNLRMLNLIDIPPRSWTFVLFVLLNLFKLGKCGLDLTMEPGHLKPFGDGRPTLPVEEFQGFPNPKYFFENYAIPLKPLKMVGAAKFSPAFKIWTDEYFLGQAEPKEHRVTVETKKKEDRKQPVLNMSFKNYVRTYNNSDNYMVNAVPDFIKHDVVMPCPLQCKTVVEKNLVDNVMWFSSGGTKSVVHTDSVDNINCLLRGEKTLIFVDPGKYRDKVDIDRPEGSYSAVDVDSVDYEKYPGLAEVEFYHVNVSAGDCLYIPYLWIHQVRSYGSNLAVNVWWQHYLTDDLDFTDCNDPCDPSLTLKDGNFKGFGGEMLDPDQLRDHLRGMLGGKTEFDFHAFVQLLLGEDHEEILQDQQQKAFFLKMFSKLDLDKSGSVSEAEIQDTPNNVYGEIGELIMELEGDQDEGPDDDGVEEINIDDDEIEDAAGYQPLDDSDETDLHDEL